MLNGSPKIPLFKKGLLDDKAQKKHFETAWGLEKMHILSGPS
jgi:hypothetical protein